MLASLGCFGELLCLGDRIVDGADHVEGSFRQVIIFAVDHRFERADRVFQRNEQTGRAGEHFGHEEGLREEALDLTGACNGQLIFFRQFIHAENSDDVLQRLVALERFLHLAGHIVVFFANDGRVEHTRRGVEWIHSR